jgi:hypothetical protein
MPDREPTHHVSRGQQAVGAASVLDGQAKRAAVAPPALEEQTITWMQGARTHARSLAETKGIGVEGV